MNLYRAVSAEKQRARKRHVARERRFRAVVELDACRRAASGKLFRNAECG